MVYKAHLILPIKILQHRRFPFYPKRKLSPKEVKSLASSRMTSTGSDPSAFTSGSTATHPHPIPHLPTLHFSDDKVYRDMPQKANHLSTVTKRAGVFYMYHRRIPFKMLRHVSTYSTNTHWQSKDWYRGGKLHQHKIECFLLEAFCLWSQCFRITTSHKHPTF